MHINLFFIAHWIFLFQHALPNIQVPNHTEDCIYPLPFAVFHLFSNDDLQCTPGPGCLLPPPDNIDRFLMDETVRCIVNSHENNRKEWWVLKKCRIILYNGRKFSLDKNFAQPSYRYICTLALWKYLVASPPKISVLHQILKSWNFKGKKIWN